MFANLTGTVSGLNVDRKWPSLNNYERLVSLLQTASSKSMSLGGTE